MNNPNPFVPKGSLLEQQNLRRSRLKITVGCVLALSVCALVAMLIEGCKREAPSDQTQTPPDLTSSQAGMDTNPPAPAIQSNAMPMMATAPSNTAPQQLPPIPMPPQQPPPQPVPDQTTGAASTYDVVAGDTLGKIAKSHGVTLKALEAANPGVDPKKLKVKQKLNIPAPTATATATPDNSMSGNAAGTSSGGTQYVVKSGDTLSKIAKHNGVTLKALRAANPSIASTDHIKVGDKLTIPAKAENSAPATTTDTSAPPMLPAPPSTPAPGTPAPSAPAPGH